MRRIKTLALTLLCTAAIIGQTVVGVGQTNRGGISGTVTDSTGAVVSGATVTITNVGTNQVSKLTTSESGSYSATSLEPVIYRVAVEAGGFKKALVDGVKVDTATTSTVNITLELGNIDNVVTVSGADALLLNKESGTSGQTITERQIVEMPLNNRSVLDLALTVGNVSGVAGTEDPELSSGEIPAPGFNISVNGGRAGSTSILADGARNTGVGLGRALVTFSPDTIQEFTVQTSNFSAEYGSTGGGVINMSTKSGTNRFNGLFYWYHRNPSLNAAPFTTSASNRPESNRRQHQFGLTVGGPVWPPKYTTATTALFSSSRSSRGTITTGRSRLMLLPTPAMLTGDFSNVVLVNGGYAPRDVAERFGLADTDSRRHDLQSVHSNRQPVSEGYACRGSEFPCLSREQNPGGHAVTPRHSSC